ncbi:MAG TPA: MarR family transcriptional regulator [Pseudonocardiaceae bacterium]|jgi:DNA-binding MarR family transcriptional regulator
MATEPGTAASSAALPTEPASVPAFNFVLALHRLLRGLRTVLPPGQFNPTQLLILSQLAGSDPIRVGELAHRVYCSQPTATTVVNALAAAGLVERIKDTEDGRAIKVSLTESGMGMLHGVGRQEAAFLDTIMNELPDDEKATMIAAIPIMLRIADASTERGRISGLSERAGTSDRSTKTGS